MKIEIIEVKSYEALGMECSWSNCYEAGDSIRHSISNEKCIYGIAIIDGTAVKFAFSPAGMDGTIGTTNSAHRQLLKCVIPGYVYASKIVK